MFVFPLMILQFFISCEISETLCPLFLYVYIKIKAEWL